MSSPANDSDCGNNWDKYLKKFKESQLNKWYDESYNPGWWGIADGYHWGSRAFAWTFGYACAECPSGDVQQPSKLLKVTSGPQEERIKIVFFERDKTGKKYLTHPNCGGKKIKYKTKDSIYGEIDMTYDEFISQCDFCPGWRSCDPYIPNYKPTCDWTERNYDLNGAKIRLTVKEQW